MKPRPLLLSLTLGACLVALFAVLAERIYQLVVERRAANQALAQAPSTPAERQAPLFEVAPAPLPTGVPYAAAADGGASKTVDRAALRSLLLHQKYAELNAAFDLFQGEFEANQALESGPIDAGDAFDVAEAPLTEVLDAWVAATPQHFAPYLARGANLVALGYAKRGGELVAKTPQADLDAMSATLGRANDDLVRALAFRPGLVAAQRLRIMAYRAFADLRGRTAFDEARASCPTCLRPAVTFVYSLTPRWGGSYASMKAFADEQVSRGVPGAKVLGGFAALDRSEDLVRQQKLEAAASEVSHALDYGDHADFYAQRAEIEERQQRYPIALVDIDHALALWPQRPSTEVTRARILSAMHEWERSGEQLLQALRANANASGAKTLRDFVVGNLVYEGWESHKAGDRGRALRFLDLAAELSPGNADIGRRRAWAVIGADAGAAETVTGADDIDFRDAQRKDYELSRSGRFDEIVPIWDLYLQHHPDDTRAWLERCGTHHHIQGHAAQSAADCKRACELGSNEGCLRVRQLAQ